jgi:uncharacterized repeat protein (TIGR03803 family)
MRDKRLSVGLMAAFVVLTATLFVTSAWAASREKILHNFGDHGNDGILPSNGALIFDSAGNLYGTTYAGGTGTACNENCGTVFELTPESNGGWTEKILHNFGHGSDGSNPAGSLIFDASGNLYGTTTGGGSHGACTVFELSPNASGGWSKKVLHSFNHKDGLNPYANLILDAAGNLYGTTATGGSGTDCFGYGCGTVFELTQNSSGDWTEKVLHTFHKNRDGWLLYDSLIFDAVGNLYGTTSKGGTVTDCLGNGCGTVFELTPKADGGWSEKVLHRFNSKDGGAPNGLIFDASGNLYGTTYFGGRYSNRFNCPSGCGTVFELMPTAEAWNERLIHNFDDDGKDGFGPSASLIFDAAGNLYGTTAFGRVRGTGTVFEMTPTANGDWNEKVLHSFQDNSGDGQWPIAAVVMGAAGNLYGTTEIGGSVGGGGGTAFEIER